MAKKKTKPSTEQLLWQMWHDLLAKCQQMLAGDERLGATEMNVIRAFLKDNHIVIDAEHEQDIRAGLSRLSDLGLPFSKH